MVGRTFGCRYVVFRLRAGWGGGGLLGSEGVVDQMTMSAPQDLGLKGDRTVFGLHHAGSAVLFK